MSLLAHQGFLLREQQGPPGGDSYNDLVAALNPTLWWRLEETSGAVAADSSGNGLNGVLAGGDFSSYSAPPVAGYAGVGRGVDQSVNPYRIRYTGAAANFGESVGSKWAIAVVRKSAGLGQQYVVDRGNYAAILSGYNSPRTVEFLASGYTGQDPRPGSQLPLSDDAPALYVYRYNAGTWAGFRNDEKVFEVARSFSLNQSQTYFEAHENDSGILYDFWIVKGDSIPTDAQIAAIWAARDIAA